MLVEERNEQYQMYLYQSCKWIKDLPMSIMEITQLVPVLVILTPTQVKAFGGAWLGIRGTKDL